MKTKEFDPRLDQGIEQIVTLLRESGIDTYESCEGGRGHAYLEPTVRFHGEYADGFKAYSIAVSNGFPVAELRRVYSHEDSELKGPWWELTFAPTKVV